MRLWAIPAVLLAFFAGYAVGRIGMVGDPRATPSPKPADLRQEPSPSNPSQAGGTAAFSASPGTSPLVASAPVRTSRQRLLDQLSPFLDPAKQYQMLLNVAAQNLKLQREVFEMLRATDDPALMEECQILLTGIQDAILLKEVMDAFHAERNADRQLAWAYILGGTWRQDAVRPLVLDILEGNDTKLQTRMLEHLWLQSLPATTPDVERERATSRLRLLVKAGETDALRTAAAESMRGVRKAEDVAFLIETMLQDPSAQVQSAAFESLPSNYQWPTPLLAEQTRAMYEAAIDERRDARLRRAMASRALQNSDLDHAGPEAAKILSPQERTVLKMISEKKD